MSETIGDKLKQARAARRLTLDDATKATRIRTHYLEALERGDVSAIPSAAQARGFLRVYADFLGLDPDSLVPVKDEPESASSPDLQPAPAPEIVSPPEPPRPNLLTSLRERFTRRAAVENPAPAEQAKPESQPPAPEPKPFAPARYTEELPAEPAPAVQESAPSPEPTPTMPHRKTTPRKNATKSASKRVKLLDSIEGADTEEVKKKLIAVHPSLPRAKRG